MIWLGLKLGLGYSLTEGGRWGIVKGGVLLSFILNIMVLIFNINKKRLGETLQGQRDIIFNIMNNKVFRF